MRAQAEAAIKACAALDTQRFRALVGPMEQDLACLGAVAPPDTAAQVHLALALAAWIDKDADGTLASFRGLVAAAPGFDLPEDLAPKGGRVRALFDSAKALGPGGASAFPYNVFVVDGLPDQDAVPSERAALVQRRGAGGTWQTWYLHGGDLPAALVAPPPALQPSLPPGLAPPAAATLPSTPPGRTAPEKAAGGRGGRGRPSRNLLIASALTGIASGASLGYAASVKGNFADIATLQQAEKQEGLNHLAGWGGWALAVASGSLVVGAVAVARW